MVLTDLSLNVDMRSVDHMENLEMGQFIFNKGTKVIQWERDSLFNEEFGNS